MDTLHERLAELADEAPTGGAPAAELWARGKRVQRLRAAAVAATVLVVGAVGAGIGFGLSDGDNRRDGPDPAPAVNLDISLPIEYPTGEELFDLGDAPGPLAAIWVTPRVDGRAPEVVGVVAATGEFGTLPVEVSGYAYAAADPEVALSPDGRRIASWRPSGELIVRDLVSGETYSPTFDFDTRGGGFWVDATHLVGHALRDSAASSETGVPRASDVDGWMWEPGAAPVLVNLIDYPGQPYLGYGWPYAGKDLLVLPEGPRACESPNLMEVSTEEPNRTRFEVPMLCDVVGVVDPEVLLGHWNPKHLAGETNGPDYADGTVVALDIYGADRPYLELDLRAPGAGDAFNDPARRRVVVTAGAPHRVAFATDLIAEALDTEDGVS